MDVLVERATRGPGPMIARDLALAQAVAAGQRGNTLRLWENAPCVAVRRHGLRQLPPEAPREMARRGFPLVERLSGGGPVPHLPGVLNVSLFLARSPHRVSLDDEYSAFVGAVRAALEAVGLRAEVGEVPGAPCPGRWDLGVGGRKVFGASLARLRGVMVLHGWLLTGAQPEAVVAPLALLSELGGPPCGAGARAFLTCCQEHLAREVVFEEWCRHLEVPLVTLEGLRR